MKYYNPVLLFLDDDLKESAKCLTNEHLDLLIKRTVQIIFCGLFYFIGIRSKRFYQFYFSKEKKDESIRRWFPNYPFKKFPQFSFYNSEESKWIRKCGDHLDYIINYFYILTDEYFERFSRDHDLSPLRDLFDTIIVDLTNINGVQIPYVGLKKIILPWKNLHPRFRRKNIIEGYREYYRFLIANPFIAYSDTKRDIPQWLLQGRDITDYDSE